MHILFSRGRQPASPLGHLPDAMRGHASQAMPHTPIFSEDRSEDIIHYYPALAYFADKFRHLDVLGMLLVTVKSFFALEF